MKRSLIAVAAMSLAGLAAAQSSVTLYGIADYWVGNVKSVGSTTGSGGLLGSRWGVKGTEDLGGGLNAGFLFEQGINLATGATAGGFNRQAYLSLGGDFGEVKFGNVFTPLDDIIGSANSGFDSILSATSGVWVGYNSNPFSQVYYSTPDFAGFNAAVSRNLNGDSSTAVTSMRLNYANGPIYAGFSHQTDKQSNPGFNVKHTLLNGSYDLGVVKLLASVRNVTNPDSGADKARELQVGLDVPLNDFLTLSAGYANSSDKTAGVEVADRQGLGLAFTYALSKRTTVYGGVQQAKEKLADTKDRLVAVGINHKF